MLEAGNAALALGAAVVVSTAGMGWLALAMDVHWEQVRAGAPLTPTATVRLRLLGTASLLVSLLLCLWVDHASMAVLVWVMSIGAAALAIALTLTWRPALLRSLAWAGATKAVTR